MAEKKLSHLSTTSDDFSVQRQSLLLRELEMLLDLHPRSLSSSLLSLPRELRDRIIDFVLPDFTAPTTSTTPPSNTLTVPNTTTTTTTSLLPTRPDLHTCLWGADMIHEPWRHDIFGYGHDVPFPHRLHPNLLLLNRQLRTEILHRYWAASKLTLHAELRNSAASPAHFDFSPHVPSLPLLRHVTHVRFYVEWNYVLKSGAGAREKAADQVRIAEALVRSMDGVLGGLEAGEGIEVVVLFFWRWKGGKHYMLSMGDLFELEEVFKRRAEERWLRVVAKSKTPKSPHTQRNPQFPNSDSDLDSDSEFEAHETDVTGIRKDSSAAGVGYKLSCEDRGTEQSGGMEIFVSRDLEEAMGAGARRKSMVDFYGNYGIGEPLPCPGYREGPEGMI